MITTLQCFCLNICLIFIQIKRQFKMWRSAQEYFGFFKMEFWVNCSECSRSELDNTLFYTYNRGKKIEISWRFLTKTKNFKQKICGITNKIQVIFWITSMRAFGSQPSIQLIGQYHARWNAAHTEYIHSIVRWPFFFIL